MEQVLYYISGNSTEEQNHKCVIKYRIQYYFLASVQRQLSLTVL